MSLARTAAWAGLSGLSQSAAPISLRQTFIWSFAGNAIYRGAQWGLLIVLAKLSSADMTGRFALAFAITAPVFMLSNLQSRALLITDAAGEFRFRDYVALRVLTTILAALTVVAVVVWAAYPWPTMLIILAVTAAKAVESMSDIYHGALQRQERMDAVGVSLIVKGALSLVAFSAALYLTGSVLVGSVILAVSWALVFVCYDIPVTRGIRQRDRAGETVVFRRLLPLVGLGFPLGIVMMLLSLRVSIPRLFVEGHLGEAQLGVYAAMAYVMIAGEMVVNSVAQTAAPRLARFHVAGEYAAFRQMAARLLGVGACLGLMAVGAVAVAGRDILTIVYRPEYARHVDVFLILVAASAVGYLGSFLGCVSTASRFLKTQIPISLVAVGVSAVGCLLLVPTHGLRGAALAELLAAAIQAAGLLWLTRRALRELRFAAPR